MQPKKERAPWILFEPCQRAVHNLHPPALNALIAVFARATGVKGCVVRVKAAVEASSASALWVEYLRSHKSRGAIAFFMQNVGKIRQIGSERGPQIAHVIELRESSREDRRVRRRGQRHLRICADKNRGLAGQRIQVRRKFESGIQKSHSVGTRSIQCDDDNVDRFRKTRE